MVSLGIYTCYSTWRILFCMKHTLGFKFSHSLHQSFPGAHTFQVCWRKPSICVLPVQNEVVRLPLPCRCHIPNNARDVLGVSFSALLLIHWSLLGETFRILILTSHIFTIDSKFFKHYRIKKQTWYLCPHTTKSLIKMMTRPRQIKVTILKQATGSVP